MLLQILRALESLAAEVALVWFERDMHANVRGDVVAFDGGGSAGTPLAGEVEVVGALAADMALADVVLDRWSAHAWKHVLCRRACERLT
jgi:hypothetical protein